MALNQYCKKICLALSVVVACCTWAVADMASLPYDHYNPVVLNQYAVQKIREGDLSSARIMLERAHLLAPHETRIERNLRTLRQLQTAGQKSYQLVILPVNAPGAQTSPEAAPSEAEVLPPYPLWEIK
jgi:hypothetical protein